MAVICQPDCARRHPGCHDHCEEYAEKSSARKKQLEEYEAKNMNPYCCRWTHHETNRNMKRKFKGHDPPASKMSSRSSKTRRADLWDVAMFA